MTECFTFLDRILSGYGNITPRTIFGKSITIVYAIVGMPLFLLYLSNIGDIMAKSFKWIYARVCLCRICPGVAKRREARLRRKIRALERQLNDEYVEDVRFILSNLMDGPITWSELTSFQEDYESDEEEIASSVTSSSTTLKNENINDNGQDESSSSSSQSTGNDLNTVSVPISVCLMIMIR